jgi:hypothetical protein
MTFPTARHSEVKLSIGFCESPTCLGMEHDFTEEAKGLFTPANFALILVAIFFF